MIIDCHGHYTGAPAPLRAWRDRQLKAFEARSTFDAPIRITDDEIRETLEKSQVKAQRERGTDVTLFSPIAGQMGHHLGDRVVSERWTRVCNDLVHRACELYPSSFIGVCQLPQSPGV